jgi:hypothetical protein
MKAELYNVLNKGLCIVISEIDPKDFHRTYGIRPTYPHMELRPNSNSVFNNIGKIADAIRIGHKIAAIKEIRGQTGWGLKESKEYVDKYIWHPMESDRYIAAAEKFIDDHAPIPISEDFIDSNEMVL